MDLIALLVLKIELGRWSRRGRTPVVWWRDDDARHPTDALDRLLDLADGLPLSLAVIPDEDLAPLAGRLAGAANVTISQHGVDHANRSPPGHPASEYGIAPARSVMARRIGQGRAVLAAAGLAPAFFTPPWNEIDPSLPKALEATGFRQISAYEGSAPCAGLERVDCSLDLLRWKGGARFRGWGPTLRRLTRLLRQRRRSGAFERPIGVLTHHLVQDEAAWTFLEWLLAFGRRRFVWRRFEDLAGGPS